MKYSSLFFVSFLAFWLSGCDIEELKDKLEGEFVDYGSPLAENTSKPSDPARTLPPTLLVALTGKKCQQTMKYQKVIR